MRAFPGSQGPRIQLKPVAAPPSPPKRSHRTRQPMSASTKIGQTSRVCVRWVSLLQSHAGSRGSWIARHVCCARSGMLQVCAHLYRQFATRMKHSTARVEAECGVEVRTSHGAMDVTWVCTVRSACRDRHERRRSTSPGRRRMRSCAQKSIRHGRRATAP